VIGATPWTNGLGEDETVNGIQEPPR